MKKLLLSLMLCVYCGEVLADTRSERTSRNTYPPMRVLSCNVCGDPERHHSNYGAVVFNEYIYGAGPEIFASGLTGTPYVKVENLSAGTYAIVWIEFVYVVSAGQKALKFKINVQPPSGKALSYFSAAVLVPHVVTPVDPAEVGSAGPTASAPRSGNASNGRSGGARGGGAGGSYHYHHYYYLPSYGGAGRIPVITIHEEPRNGG